MKTLIKFGVRSTAISFEPVPGPQQLLRISRASDVTGVMNTMDLPVTEDQLHSWLGSDNAPGRLIQDVMPHLSAEQREFLISGLTPAEWAKFVVGTDGDEK